MLGKADDLLICPVRSRWSVKSLGITYNRVVAVLITASGLQGE